MCVFRHIFHDLIKKNSLIASSRKKLILAPFVNKIFFYQQVMNIVKYSGRLLLIIEFLIANIFSRQFRIVILGRIRDVKLLEM